MRKLIFFEFFLIFFTTNLKAQIPNSGHSIATENSIPQSPTASGLGKFSDFPVNLFGGKLQIDIPIMNPTVDDFSIPISLVNSGNAVKVESSASWVGTSWNLQAGAVISREVRGEPDDYYGFIKNSTPTADYKAYGSYYLKNVYPSGFAPYSSNTGFQLMSNLTEVDNIDNMYKLQGLKNHPLNSYDTEVDIFSFNIFGRTGKFMLDPDTKQPIQEISSGLKINCEFNPLNVSSNDKGFLKKITVLDENGVEYVFDQIEKTGTKVYSTRYILWASNPPDHEPYYGTRIINTAWYLSKVKLINGEEINFEYQNEEQLFPNTTPSNSYRASPANIDCEYSTEADPNYQNNFPQRAVLETSLKIDAKRLSTIESRLFKVNFEATTLRLDLKNSNRLDFVKLFSKNATGALTPISTWKFYYNYRDCKTTNINMTGDWYTWYPGTTSADPFKRLFLEKIEEVNLNDSKKNQVHQFNYYEGLMGSIKSTEQDQWGYFNNSNSKTLLPEVGVYVNENSKYRKYSTYHKYDGGTNPNITLLGSQRKPNLDGITRGMISSITYPTGGKINFEYELNDYEYEGLKYDGAGVRIKKTTLFDNINHQNDIVKEYKYTNPSDPTRSSGVIFNFPIYAYMENTNRYMSRKYLAQYGSTPYSQYAEILLPNGYAENDSRRYYYYLARFYQPQMNSNGINGDSYGYKYVTVVENSTYKTVYKFSTPGEYAKFSEQSDKYQIPTNFTTKQYYSYVLHPPENSPNYSLMGVNEPYAYPFVPSTNYDWKRGLLELKEEYDNQNRVVGSKEIQYFDYVTNNGYKKINCLRTGNISNYALNMVNPNNGTLSNEVVNVSFSSKYFLIGNIARLPVREITKTYDYNNGTSVLQNTVEYEYSNLFPMVTQTKYINSKGSEIRVNNKNASFFSDAIYQDMVIRNIINPVIEQTSLNASLNTPLSKVMTNYSLWQNNTQSGNMVLPYSLQKSLGGNSLITQKSIDLYNVRGNILQTTSKNGEITAYIWGYNYQYIVAIVTNKTYSEAINQSGINQSILTNPVDEIAIKFELNKLRNLNNCLVTTYTYKPLIGITSEINPQGRTTYYEYDDFNRLVLIRDNENNIVKKICYNYAGQVENCNTSCPPNSPANWQNTSTALRCQQGSCGNTGYQEQEQKDVNPCSPTYNQIQWVVTGQNTAACPSQTCVQLTSTMVIAASNYLATYTLTSNPSIAYTFNVANQTGLQNLGTIPEGSYTLWIRRTTSNSYALFKTGCWKQSMTDVEATFYNVNVSSTTCKSITIDLSAGQ